MVKLQYTVQDTPLATPNGGVMIRSPEIRYDGATTADVLAQKPTGYNYDLCPGALALCGRHTPAAVDDVPSGRAPTARSRPPGSEKRYCSARAARAAAPRT